MSETASERIEKLCPIRELSQCVKGGMTCNHKDVGTECLRDDCAWWNPVTNLCAVSALFIAMGGGRL